MKVHELFEAEKKSILSEYGEQTEHTSIQFNCSGKELTSLEGASKVYHSIFYCHDNNLTSLKGGPEIVKKSVDCSNNPLTTLEGAPSFIGRDFYCINTELKNLHNIHKQIKHIGGEASFNRSPIESHVLGLLLIEGLLYVTLGSKGEKPLVQSIINRHLASDERDVFACQEELIENGFEDFAKL